MTAMKCLFEGVFKDHRYWIVKNTHYGYLDGYVESFDDLTGEEVVGNIFVYGGVSYIGHDLDCAYVYTDGTIIGFTTEFDYSEDSEWTKSDIEVQCKAMINQIVLLEKEKRNDRND